MKKKPRISISLNLKKKPAFIFHTNILQDGPNLFPIPMGLHSTRKFHKSTQKIRIQKIRNWTTLMLMRHIGVYVNETPRKFCK